jgi:hypothetical protein
MALTAAAFAAFLPQHLAIMASVNNDSLAELCTGAVLLGSMWLLRRPELVEQKWIKRALTPHPAFLGLLVGLAMLTKTTVYFVAAIPLAAFFLKYRKDGGDIRRLLAAAVWVVVVAALVNAPWWLRNIDTYGFPDFTGLVQHDAVVTGQPRTADWIAENGFGAWLERFVSFTYNSFWGQFGWMAVPMPGWIYAGLLAFTGVVVVGVVLALRRNVYKAETPSSGQNTSVLLLGMMALLTTLQYIVYNLSLVQHQGRYLFPALTAIAFTVALGLDGWLRPLVGRKVLPLWGRWVASFGVWFAFAVLDVYLLWRVIVPALAL